MEIPVVAWLLVLSGTDLREQRLPNALTLPGVLAALSGAAGDTSVALAVLVAVTPYAVALAVRGCGAGDVKLAVVVGALAGDPLKASGAVVLAAVLTLVAAPVAARARAGRGIAHGPAMAAAVLVVGL
ncbi:prepilin peptidase [Williamsia deligens]|uniref:Prepilin peptidase n=1 Tax=Williamsia deligens TaxID=321325 RepID=A0ABW3GG71_9NOCA|nr:A24 family peptidase [Williamsia deligens]MCP2195335.1 leader peptidase (prepilin peptidase) / N-methyltransferase [Williamsia deligens]